MGNQKLAGNNTAYKMPPIDCLDPPKHSPDGDCGAKMRETRAKVSLREVLESNEYSKAGSKSELRVVLMTKQQYLERKAMSGE